MAVRLAEPDPKRPNQKNPEINPPIAGRVAHCKTGERYKVTGYHTGDFIGEFVRQSGILTAEFRVLEHSDPDAVGTVLEVPHHLARIEAWCVPNEYSRDAFERDRNG
jgi:hypothetical protein